MRTTKFKAEPEASMTKAFLSLDIEGVAGVSSWDEASPSKPDYGPAARRLTLDVVAACEGITAAGFSEILIKDAHGREARNVDIEALPEPARVHRGWSGHPAMMMDGLDSGFAFVGFIGYHSGGGMAGNPLSHTFYGQSRVVVNGRPMTEFEMNAWYAAELGVPTLFLSGDAEICGIAKEWDPRIETVVASTGRGNASTAEHPAVVRRAIREKMARAAMLAHKERVPKTLPERFDVEVTWLQHQHAYWASFFPEVEQTGPCSIRFSRTRWFEVLRTLHYTLYVPSVLRT